MKSVIEQRKRRVFELLQDYEVKIIVSPYSASKSIEFSKLKIKQFYLPLNSDYSMTSKNDAMNGILTFASLTNGIADALDYQLLHNWDKKCIFFIHAKKNLFESVD